jgi:hypothetical protein
MSVQKLLGTRGLGVVPLPLPAVAGQKLQKDLHQIGTLEGVFEEYFLVSAKRKIENPIAAAVFKRFKA